MKNIPLAIIALAASVSATAQAQSNVTIFGIVDVAVESIKSGSNSATRIQSGGTFQSRFGFRGSEDLGGGLKAIFNLENRFALDDGSMVQGLMFGGRSIVGLTGDWGSLVLGREYIPIYQLKTGSNPFVFMTYSATQVMMRGGASKSDNAIRYDSPVWAGASFAAMYSMGDENPLNSKAGWHTGFAVQYATGDWWAGAGINRVEVNSPSVDKTNEYLAGLRYKLPVATLYGNFWRLDTKNRTQPDGKIDLWTIGASTPVFSNGVVMATYAWRNTKAPSASAGDDATQLLLGYEHSLSKRTTLYTQYTRVQNDQRSNIIVSGFANAGVGTANVSDPRAFQVGIRHTF